MERRQRIEKTLAGESVDRVPVFSWRFWQGDDQRSADLAKAVLQFQQAYDWDVVVVPPAPHALVSGYGLQDDWRGELSGKRTVLKYPIQRSLDWTELRPLDVLRGDTHKFLEALRLLNDAPALAGCPMLPVVFSPLTQALQLAPRQHFLRHLRTQPDRLQTGLNALTESTLRLLEAFKRLAIDGIYYVMEGASMSLLSEAEYEAFGLPYDEKVLQALPNKWWLSMAHFVGDAPMLKFASHLPVSAVGWEVSPHNPTLGDGKLITQKATFGGVARAMLHEGTPLSIKDVARHAVNATNGRKFFLSCDGASLVTTPLSNLQALRDSVRVAVL